MSRSDINRFTHTGARRPEARPTPRTTIEAILYCVRERGIGALKEPENIERLSRCDAPARAEINARIEQWVEVKRIIKP